MKPSLKEHQPSPGRKSFSQAAPVQQSFALEGVISRREFKNTMLGSRVADGNGEPLVVYHGTQTEVIEKFDPRKTDDDAIHFSSDYAVALWIANNNGRGDADRAFPNVVPAYLSIKNLRTFTEKEIGRFIGEGEDRDWSALSQVVFESREAGFDGIRLVGMTEENGLVSDHWLAFDGNQVIPFTGPRERVVTNPKNHCVSLVGYHGTENQFDALEPSLEGSFGPGFYFTGEPGEASCYGGRVIARQITLKNPWRIAAGYDTDLGTQEDFDSPSVDAVLSLAGGRELLERAKQAWCGGYDQLLQDHLCRLGHDGIIATYPDGCKEIVAFYENQLSPARSHTLSDEPKEAFSP